MSVEYRLSLRKVAKRRGTWNISSQLDFHQLFRDFRAVAFVGRKYETARFWLVKIRIGRLFFSTSNQFHQEFMCSFIRSDELKKKANEQTVFFYVLNEIETNTVWIFHILIEYARAVINCGIIFFIKIVLVHVTLIDIVSIITIHIAKIRYRTVAASSFLPNSVNVHVTIFRFFLLVLLFIFFSFIHLSVCV